MLLRKACQLHCISMSDSFMAQRMSNDGSLTMLMLHCLEQMRSCSCYSVSLASASS